MDFSSAFDKKRKKILLGVILAFAAVFFIGIMIPIQMYIHWATENIKIDLISRAEQVIGGKITYESASPAVFFSIEFRKISLLDENGELASFKKVRISYSILDLIFSKRTDIKLFFENVTIELNDRRARILGEKLELLRKDFFADGNQNIGRIFISGNNINISLNSDVGLVQGRKISFNIEIEKNKWLMRTQGIIETTFSVPVYGFSKVVMPFSYSAKTIDSALVFIDLGISATTEQFSIKKQRLRAVLKPDSIHIVKVEDVAPVNISFQYDSNNETWSLDAMFDKFPPIMMISFNPKTSQLSTLNQTLLSGSCSFSGKFKSPKIVYQGNIQAQLPKSFYGGMQIAGRFNGNQIETDIENFSVKSVFGEIKFNGSLNLLNMLPNGELEVDGLLNGKKILFGAYLTRTQNAVDFFSESIQIGRTKLNSVAAFIEKDGLNYSYSLSAYLPQTYESELGGSTTFSGEILSSSDPSPLISSSGQLSLREPVFFDGTITLEYFPSSVFAGMLEDFGNVGYSPIISIINSYVLNAEIYFSTNFKEFAYNAAQIAVSSIVNNNYGAFSISGNSKQLEISSLSFFIDNTNIRSNVIIDFIDDDNSKFDVSLNINDIAYSFSGKIADGNAISITGDYGLIVSAYIQENELVFYLKAMEFPLPIAPLFPLISLDCSGRYAGLDNWSLYILNSGLSRRSDTLSPFPIINASGEFNEHGGRFTKIELSDRFSTLNGTAELKIASLFPASVEFIVKLKNDSGENYVLESTLENETIKGLFSVRNSPLSRFQKTVITSNFNADIKIDGLVTAPIISFAFELVDGFIGKDKFDLRTHGIFSETEILLTDLSASFNIHSIKNGSFRIDRTSNEFSYFANYEAQIGNNTLESSFRGSSKKKDRIIDKEISSFGFFENTRFLSYSVPSWPINFNFSDNLLTITGGVANELSIVVSNDGGFYAKIISPFPISAVINGKVEGTTIQADVRDFHSELQFIWSLTGIKTLDLSKGKISGSFKINGNIEDPDFFGSASISDASGNYPSITSVPFGPISLDVSAIGKELVFEKKSIPLGNSSFFLNLRLLFENWLPIHAILNVVIPEQFPAPFKTNIAGIYAEGNAFCNLSLDSSWQKTTIIGTVTLENCTTYMENTDSSKNSYYPVVSNIKIQIGKNNQFIYYSPWAVLKIPLIKAYLEQNSVIQSFYDGNTLNYAFTGTVSLKGGEIRWLERNFYLKSGKLVFNENAKSLFDPLISLRGEMRERNDDGMVTIYFIVDSSRMSQINPRFESVPSLSQTEIIQMLGSAITKTDDLGKFVIKTTDMIELPPIKVFEENVRNVFGLDMFSIRTQVLQNIIIDYAKSTGGTGFQSDAFDYFDNSSIFLGKYLGTDLFFQAMVQLQMETMADMTKVMTYNMELGLEMQTPLFLLQWKFKPEHMESLFVPDQSFVLNWRYSF